MTYIPGGGTPAPGSITTTELGGDITTLMKDLLTQATTDDAKTTLAVSDPGVVVPFTF